MYIDTASVWGQAKSERESKFNASSCFMMNGLSTEDVKIAESLRMMMRHSVLSSADAAGFGAEGCGPSVMCLIDVRQTL